MIVYVSINSPDSQSSRSQWAIFYGAVNVIIHQYADHVHGRWTSPAPRRMSACWRFEMKENGQASLKRELFELARTFQQRHVIWEEGKETEFL